MSKNWRRFSNAFTSRRSSTDRVPSIESGSYALNMPLHGGSTTAKEIKTISLRDLKPNEDFEKYKRSLQMKVESQRKKIRDHDSKRRSMINFTIHSKVQKYNNLLKKQKEKITLVKVANKEKFNKPQRKARQKESMPVKSNLIMKISQKKRNSIFGMFQPQASLLQDDSTGMVRCTYFHLNGFYELS